MIIVPVSGGKDSQCCLELAIQTGDIVEGLFNDTGWEHPSTYAHIKWMQKYYGVKIHKTKGKTVPEIVLEKGMFPDSMTRFCTRDLKIRPAKRFYEAHAVKLGHGFEVWVGIRTGESNKRARAYKDKISTELYPPHEYMSEFPKKLEKLGVYIRLPIVDWTTEEVFKQLDGRENRLYRKGQSRVGCFPCLVSGDANKKRDFESGAFGRKRWVLVQEMEQAIGKTVWTSKKGQEENNSGCSFCEI